MSTSTPPGTVSAMELAGFLDLSRNRIAELAARGAVVRTAHGRYQLKESVQGYLAYLRARCDGSRAADPARSARQRLDDANARLAETELEAVEGEWLPVGMLTTAVSELQSVVREKLAGLESRVPPLAAAATRAAVAEALKEIDDHGPAAIAECVARQVKAERRG